MASESPACCCPEPHERIERVPNAPRTPAALRTTCRAFLSSGQSDVICQLSARIRVRRLFSANRNNVLVGLAVCRNDLLRAGAALAALHFIGACGKVPISPAA